MPTHNMTAAWVEQVKAAESREEWFDAKATGLGLRVSNTGKKVWFVFYRVQGESKRRRLTLGPYPALPLAEARIRAKEVLLAAHRGGDLGADKQALKAAPTFDWLAAEYIERYAKGPGKTPRKRTWEVDQRMLKNEVLPYWGHKKVHTIARRDIMDLIDRIVDRGAGVYANRVLAMLRKLFSWALDRELIEVDPCHKVKAPTPEKPRERRLDEDEIRAVWAAAESESTLVAGMLKLRLLTAQRGGEVATMRWVDVDFATGWWTIPTERAKNGREHRVPLSPMALKVLRDLQAETGHQAWVFPSPTKRNAPITNVQKMADRLRMSSGVIFKLHDLRRTVGSGLGQLRVNRTVTAKVLNHAEGGVTSVYDRHTYDDEKREALELWGTWLEGVLGVKCSV
jgi:integrase